MCNGNTLFDGFGYFLDVGGKQAGPLWFAGVPQFFGVRLDAYRKMLVGRFDDLDHAITTFADDAHVGRHVTHRLMVHAVGLDDGLSQRLGQPTLFVDLDVVG